MPSASVAESVPTSVPPDAMPVAASENACGAKPIAEGAALTITPMLAVVSAETDPFEVSRERLRNCSEKSAALPAGGTIRSADRVQPLISTDVDPAVAVKVRVPSLSCAPTGMASI